MAISARSQSGALMDFQRNGSRVPSYHVDPSPSRIQRGCPGMSFQGSWAVPLLRRYSMRSQPRNISEEDAETLRSDMPVTRGFAKRAKPGAFEVRRRRKTVWCAFSSPLVTSILTVSSLGCGEQSCLGASGKTYSSLFVYVLVVVCKAMLLRA
jgi:hypothetical protein